jgi:hypothetical protein
MTDGATPPPAGGQPWHQGVDAGVITAWQNKGYDLADPKAMATKMWEQYAHLESHLGVPADRLLRLPKDVADAAGWDAIHQRLGAPKDAAGYDFAGIKFGDGTELEAGFTDTMRGALHKAHVSKEAAPEIVKAVIKYLDDADASEKTVHTTKLDEQKATLAKSWGPKADENMLAAKQGARRLGVDAETVQTLENALGYDKVMEMFRKVGHGTSEDTFLGGGPPGNPTTQQGAQARMDELQKDAAWVSRLMAGDATTRREFDALMEQISGVAA